MAAKKVMSSKAGSVAKAVKSKAKSVEKPVASSVKKRVPAKTGASSTAKTVKSGASTAKPAASKAKVSAVKTASKASKAPAKGNTPAVKTASKASKAPAKGNTPAVKTASKPKKAPAKGKSQAKVAVSAPAGDVHETASTISTGGQTTRSFSSIMQGHAAIAKGIEARKAAAKAKNLARFPHPATLRVKTTRKLTEKQSKSYEQMLLRLRDELSRQIAFLRGASLTRSDEVNPEEDGSDAFERQLALKLASNEGDAIFEIDEALQRIKDGSYAICEDCGCIINSARLKALPFVRRCVECKRIAEKKRTAGDRLYF